MTAQPMIPHSAPCLGEEEVQAAARVLRSGRLAQGPEVEAFERECAEAFGRAHAVAASSGTNALHLALAAVGVDEGDTVAVPSYACAALITAIGLQRAESKLCDIDGSYNLDPDCVAGGVCAVIVPHLFGATARLPEHDCVIEDIAQSIGGETGRGSRVAVASFYATKLMTTGEGGMLLTDDEALADFARDRRDYDNRDAFKQRYSYKMTEVQAAVGRAQLKKLPGFIMRRRELAAQYAAGLASLPFQLPEPREHVFFRYVVATPRRDALAAHLADCGIDAKRPVYRPAHHYLGGDFPRSEQAHRECLSLPLYPSLRDEDAARVIESVMAFF